VHAEPTLFMADAELIQRLGVPEKIAYAAIHVLDRTRHSGFPQKQATWGNSRYWPAVKQWFDRRYGVGPGRTRANRSPRQDLPRRWRRSNRTLPIAAAAAS